MALIDIRCTSCDTISEVYRAAKDHPWTPACPKCDATATEQIHLPRGVRGTAPAVVVYQAPDGTFRFPGETDGSATQKYDNLGYTRVEARGWAEVRRLEGRMNTQQSSEMRQRIEREQALREHGERARRSDVYNGMANSFSVPEVDERTGKFTGRLKTVKLSEHAKDVMRAAIAHNDAKRRGRSDDAGVHVEVYSNDRSNRDDSRGASGKRYRD